jgi:hypothetical protein
MRTQEADASLMEAAGLDRARNPDDSLSVRFSIEPLENPAKTKDAGRPIYDDAEVIEIRVPGDKDVVRHPVTDGDRLRFARHYQAWKANQNQDTVTGTPLSVWPPIKRSQVEEAKFFAVHTVEQLAEVSDVNLQRLGPGWITLRQLAIDWLKKAHDGALVGKLRATIQEQEQRLAALEDMLKKQAAELHKPGPTLSVVPPPAQNADFEALKMQVATLLARTAQAVDVTSVPTTTTTTLDAPPSKKKRGRPSKADIAAREATKKA